MTPLNTRSEQHPDGLHCPECGELLEYDPKGFGWGHPRYWCFGCETNWPAEQIEVGTVPGQRRKEV